MVIILIAISLLITGCANHLTICTQDLITTPCLGNCVPSQPPGSKPFPAIIKKVNGQVSCDFDLNAEGKKNETP